MRTIGQILQDERLKRGFTLEQVEKATKIRARHVTHIEADDFNKLPPSPYIEGFIKNYSAFLSLKSATILALFRRQYAQIKKQQPKIIEEPLTDEVKLTPNKAILGFVVLLVIGLSVYFYKQFKDLHAPPPLLVISPKEELVIKNPSISVYGDTDRDATLTINNEPILVTSDGKFFKDINLDLGNNTIVIEAKNRGGETTTVIRKVTRLTN